MLTTEPACRTSPDFYFSNEVTVIADAQKIKVFMKSILFCKYLRNGSLDLYEILCGGQLLSCELRFQIL